MATPSSTASDPIIVDSSSPTPSPVFSPIPRPPPSSPAALPSRSPSNVAPPPHLMTVEPSASPAFPFPPPLPQASEDRRTPSFHFSLAAQRRAAIYHIDDRAESDYIAAHASDPHFDMYRVWLFESDLAPVNCFFPDRPSPQTTEDGDIASAAFLRNVLAWGFHPEPSIWNAAILYTFLQGALPTYRPILWEVLVHWRLTLPAYNHPEFVVVNLDDVAVPIALSLYTNFSLHAPAAGPVRNLLNIIKHNPSLRIDKFHDSDAIGPAWKFVQWYHVAGYPDAIDDMRCLFWRCKGTVRGSVISYGDCPCERCRLVRIGVETQQEMEEVQDRQRTTLDEASHI